MLGLGTWIFDVDTMVYSGEGILIISSENGEYKFVVQTPDRKKTFNITVRSVEENGNTLEAVLGIAKLSGKDIEATLTFDGDTAEGVVKIPFMGKIKIKNGRKIED